MSNEVKEITVEEVYRAYNEGEYKNPMEYPSRLNFPHFANSHIFDEDKSVKWNKEEVERRNAERQKALKEYQEESSRQHQRLHEDLTQAIMYDHNLTREQADVVYGYCYARYHSTFSDVINNIGEIVELCEKFHNVSNK